MILRIVQILFQDTGNWASNPLLEIEFLAGSWEEDEGKKEKRKREPQEPRHGVQNCQAAS
jgi:hypothetical protein